MKAPKEHAPRNTEALQAAAEVDAGEVGVFFFFRGELLKHSVPHADGEPYGEFVNGTSDHCTFWPILQRRIPGARLYEYEQVPRGRVVYRSTDATFIVYGSERFIQNDRQKEAVLDAFHLPRDRTVFKSDEHYGDVPGMVPDR